MSSPQQEHAQLMRRLQTIRHPLDYHSPLRARIRPTVIAVPPGSSVPPAYRFLPLAVVHKPDPASASLFLVNHTPRLLPGFHGDGLVLFTAWVSSSRHHARSHAHPSTTAWARACAGSGVQPDLCLPTSDPIHMQMDPCMRRTKCDIFDTLQPCPRHLPTCAGRMRMHIQKPGCSRAKRSMCRDRMGPKI